MELYIHIPFCVSKCAYCDFLSGPSDAGTIRRYVEALTAEVRACGEMYHDRIITTVFFGGGTPSILTEEQIVVIFRAMRESFRLARDAEITIEMNPGTVTEGKLRTYREAGINRLSIGLQSVNDRELKMLGRIHTFADFETTYALARKVGFQNINMDLISAIPGQTVESWRGTLEKAVSMNPEHISAYSLIVEEGTPFYARYGEGGEGLPSEDEEREIYDLTRRFLEKSGYERYEISNYAKPGFECRHNKGYWERTDYLGIGVGAASLVNNQRFSHIRDVAEYIRLLAQENCSGRKGAESAPIKSVSGQTAAIKSVSEQNASERIEKIVTERETLDVQAQMEETMFLGLREMRGVSIPEFEAQFGKTVQDVYGRVLSTMEKEGLLRVKDERICLTERGVDISNYVMSQFLL
ncbi:oxygen-independent coproporphyrinogen-3 oxidase [Hespellia stercorisuis DSM 15480]|uniref:Heme chaperone HemW n=2 Tax=Hespellia stercorisuis TaxID=180311 RepID=A0A1M6RVM0_9FIRM|nr:oxygen-independent coproporphyrinogen-3 oxidase [Hespellia stercorisuis DSM 15480]